MGKIEARFPSAKTTNIFVNWLSSLAINQTSNALLWVASAPTIKWN
jgi:hypothetical protein